MKDELEGDDDCEVPVPKPESVDDFVGLPRELDLSEVFLRE